MIKAGEQQLNERIGYLDGLRGIAVLSVVLGHFFPRVYVFNIGWAGIVLFFVLSGYLITHRLYAGLSNPAPVYFKNFYARRILRIFPLYYGCLVLFFILLPVVFARYSEVFGEMAARQLWFWTYTSNWLIVFEGFESTQLFFHFWSLAVEEQFYLLWPLVFLLLSKTPYRKWIVLVLILSSMAFRVLSPDGMATYVNTFTAAEPLLVGALIAILEKEKLLQKAVRFFSALFVLSLGCLAIVIYKDNNLLIYNKAMLKAGYSAIDFIWAFVLVVCVVRRSSFVFSAGWIRWLGNYSYGIYVFHWLVLVLLSERAEHIFLDYWPAPAWAYYISRALCLVLVLLISWLSFELYEKRFLRLKRFFG